MDPEILARKIAELRVSAVTNLQFEREVAELMKLAKNEELEETAHVLDQIASGIGKDYADEVRSRKIA